MCLAQRTQPDIHIGGWCPKRSSALAAIDDTSGLAGIRDGIDIRYMPPPLRDVFLRMLTEHCYEACEFSLSNYLMLKDRGAHWLHAIPVFPHRRSSVIPRCTCARTALCVGRRI